MEKSKKNRHGSTFVGQYCKGIGQTKFCAHLSGSTLNVPLGIPKRQKKKKKKRNGQNSVHPPTFRQKSRAVKYRLRLRPCSPRIAPNPILTIRQHSLNPYAKHGHGLPRFFGHVLGPITAAEKERLHRVPSFVRQ